MIKSMKRKLMIAAVAILPLALFSCHDEFFSSITGQGEIVRQTITTDNFDGIVSAIDADIFISQGDKTEVVIEAQQNIIDNLDLDSAIDGILTIHYRDMVRFSKPVKIYITMPTLTKAGISGSGTMEGLTPFIDLKNLDLVISGSGAIDLDIESLELDAVISGSGEMRLSGQTENLNVLISGSGGFHATGLIAPKAETTISGSGNARLTVEDQLKALISGSGNVYYSGNPELDIHISGSGKVVRQ
jgi:hypothetical protein